MNRSSPSWSARTGRAPERGRTGANCRSPKFVCFGAEAKALGDYAALDDEATGDEIHGEFRRRRRNAGAGKGGRANESDPERRGALEIKAGCLRQRPWSD
jgi:hypothetical protein